MKIPVLYEIMIIIMVMVMGSAVSYLAGNGDQVLFASLKYLQDNEIYTCNLKEYQLYCVELELAKSR